MASRSTGGTPQSSGPVLLACIQCRQKHLKCDAKVPVCGRCDKTKSQCQYKPSRRGYKDSSKRTRVDFEEREGLDSRQPQGNGSSQIQSHWTLSPSLGSTPGHSGTSTEDPNVNQINHDWDVLLSLDQVSMGPTGQDEHLFNLYYAFFHTAHPILPPLQLLNLNNRIPLYLEVVVKFIASHFTTDADSDAYRTLAEASLIDAPNTFYKVQALLLYSIALHSRHEREGALESATKAVTIARELGMHDPVYARTFGMQNPIQEESLRRTWWELYALDCFLAAFDGKDASGTDIVDNNLPLPSDEIAYAEGRPDALAPTAAQFYSRAYAEEEKEYSSFSQRIEAIRILRRVLTLSRVGEANSEDRVDLIDASISSWFFLLPEAKTEVVRRDGSTDEMLFQAYMLVHCASIFLHFPRSNLLSPSVAVAEILCAERGNMTLPAITHHSHALKAVKAADEISSLASLPISKPDHTPFFVCALAVSAIVQLSICSSNSTRRLDPRLDKVTLSIGILKSMNCTWAVSQQILRQIRGVARGILEDNSQQFRNPVPEDSNIHLQSIVNNDLSLDNIQFPI